MALRLTVSMFLGVKPEIYRERVVTSYPFLFVRNLVMLFSFISPFSLVNLIFIPHGIMIKIYTFLVIFSIISISCDSIFLRDASTIPLIFEGKLIEKLFFASTFQLKQ